MIQSVGPRRMRWLTSVVLICGAVAVVTPLPSAPTAHAAHVQSGSAKKKCVTKKVHGKKKRVCKAVTPARPDFTSIGSGWTYLADTKTVVIAFAAVPPKSVSGLRAYLPPVSEIAQVVSIVVAVLSPAFRQAREAQARLQCVNNLKQLSLAIHSDNSAQVDGFGNGLWGPGCQVTLSFSPIEQTDLNGFAPSAQLSVLAGGHSFTSSSSPIPSRMPVGSVTSNPDGVAVFSLNATGNMPALFASNSLPAGVTFLPGLNCPQPQSAPFGTGWTAINCDNAGPTRFGVKPDPVANYSGRGAYILTTEGQMEFLTMPVSFLILPGATWEDLITFTFGPGTPSTDPNCVSPPIGSSHGPYGFSTQMLPGQLSITPGFGNPIDSATTEKLQFNFVTVSGSVKTTFTGMLMSSGGVTGVETIDFGDGCPFWTADFTGESLNTGYAFAKPQAVIFNTPVGTLQQQTVQVKNFGTKPLTITDLSLSGSSWFALASQQPTNACRSGLVMDPGDLCSFNIDFLPAGASADPVSGDVLLRTDVSQESNDDILLFGVVG